MVLSQLDQNNKKYLTFNYIVSFPITYILFCEDLKDIKGHLQVMGIDAYDSSP